MHPDGAESAIDLSGKSLNPDPRPAASKVRAANFRTRRQRMNRYTAPTPRPAFALAAVAMTALTFALFVVAPAKLHPGSGNAPASIALKSAAPDATQVLISPARIDVVGERGEKTAFEPTPSAQPKDRHAG
jgi:hypothetical protein